MSKEIGLAESAAIARRKARNFKRLHVAVAGGFPHIYPSRYRSSQEQSSTRGERRRAKLGRS